MKFRAQSGGNDSRGADLRLNEQPAQGGQLSFFPTEAEQIVYIEEAESVAQTPSAFSMFISQRDIDHILRAGGNADAARMRITAEFSKQKPLEERTAFLKNLYYGGSGLITENGKISAWYGDDGIHIANGSAARHLSSAQSISWPDAAARVEAFLGSGTFATELEVTEAPRYERLRIAVDVWNLYHDLSNEAKSRGYLSFLENIHSTSFPEESERLIDALASPEFWGRLQANQRTAVEMKYWENATDQAIADELQCSRTYANTSVKDGLKPLQRRDTDNPLRNLLDDLYYEKRNLYNHTGWGFFRSPGYSSPEYEVCKKEERNHRKKAWKERENEIALVMKYFEVDRATAEELLAMKTA